MANFYSNIYYMFAVFLCLVFISIVNVKADDCEVCIKFLTRFENTLKTEGIEKEKDIQLKLKEVCRKAKGKDNRFCYYIGGTDDAATGLLQQVTKPMSFHMPIEKICEKLKKQDSQICELRYEKEIDWKNVNLDKMRVKQLKKILMNWGEECKGCLEKPEFVRRVKELMPQYVRDEL
uniref:Mesencephalic astrocyte-derived neurotrophic factor homolog n=1 Tax=Ciona savignyi TaxID=51511 RepID=H2ZBQ1_CIOSA